jgi:hypothetical protein
MIRESLLAGEVKGNLFRAMAVPRWIAAGISGLGLIQSRTRRLVHPNFLAHSNHISGH